MAGRSRTLAFWRRVRRIALALCVTTALLWLFATLTRSSLALAPGWRITLTAGRLVVQHSPHSRVMGPGPRLPIMAWAPEWPRLLPEIVNAKAGMFSSVTVFIHTYVPLWPLPLATGLLALVAHRRVRQLSAALCPKCGYDTRGLAAGACCPECGAACSV